MLNIEQITSSRGMQEFIKLPQRLYRGHPLYVPHLLTERHRFFSSANPQFAFTEVAYFMARDSSGQGIGRITAHINHRQVQATGENTGFFGFFECIPDQAVAKGLLSQAEEWLRSRGMTRCQGPFSFSMTDECGFLSSGFDRPPGILMPYTPEYYLDYVHALGYTQAKELLAYESRDQQEIPPYMVPFVKRMRRNTEVTVRPFDLKRFDEELESAFEIYNAAWESNWGYVPISWDEFYFAASELRPLLDPSIALVAELDGQPIGFSLGVPDYSPILRRMRGRLLPFGLFHFYLGRRKLTGMRVVLLGVRKEFRNRGVDLLLYHDSFRNGIAKGYRHAEMSWILEDNMAMRRPLVRMGAEAVKTYQIVEKEL